MPELGWLSWLIVGLIVGLIGKLITKQAYPWWLTIILGIIGAVVGGLIAGLFNLGGWGFWNPMMWLFSIIGAVIVMTIVGYLGRKKA